MAVHRLTTERNMATDEQILDAPEAPPQDNDGGGDTSLSPENRTKLNGIVAKMVDNKESDDAIKFVVNDFKKKYGATQPQTSQPSKTDFTKVPLNTQVNNSSESTAAPKINTVPTDKLPDMTSEQRKTQEQVAADHLKALTDKHADEAILHISAQKMQGDMKNLNETYSSGQMSKEDYDNKMQDLLGQGFDSSAQTAQAKEELKQDPQFARLVQNTIGVLHPDVKGQINKAQYLADRPDDTQNSALQLKNANGLENGTLDYKNGTLIKPLNPIESVIKAVKNDRDAVDEYEWNKTHSDTAIMKKFLDERSARNPDIPIEQPSGISGFIGSQIPVTLKGAAIDLGVGMIPEIGEAMAPAATALGVATDMYKVSKTNALRQHFNELVDGGMDSDQAMQKAKAMAENDAMVDYAQALVMGAVGSKMGAGEIKGLELPNSFKNIAGNILKIAEHHAPESAATALTGDVAQMAKNASQGKDITEGTPQALLIGAALPMMISMVSKGGKSLVDPNTYKTIMDGLGKLPKETTDGVIDPLQSSNHLSADDATDLKNTIGEQKVKDSRIPSDITDTDKRSAVSDLLDQRDAKEKELETVHPALQKNVSEDISDIDKKIESLTAKNADQKTVQPDTEETVNKTPDKETIPILESRHANTEDDEIGKVSGQNTKPLSKDGVEDAEALRDEVALHAPDKIITSDLPRAKQTADIVSDGKIPVEENKNLRSWDLGEFSGMKDADFKKVQKFFVEHPDEKTFEGKNLGESFNDYKDRVISEREKIDKENDAGTMIQNHSNNMNIWDAYQKNGGEWNEQAAKDYLSAKTPPPATLINPNKLLKDRPKEFQDFYHNFKDEIHNVQSSSLDYRINVPDLTQAQREQAIRNIDAGKDTKTAKLFLDNLQRMHESGNVELTRGTGNHVTRMTVPIETWNKASEQVAGEMEGYKNNIPSHIQDLFDEEIQNVKNEKNSNSVQPVRSSSEHPNGQQDGGTGSSRKDESVSQRVQPDDARQSTETNGDKQTTTTVSSDKQTGNKSRLEGAVAKLLGAGKTYKEVAKENIDDSTLQSLQKSLRKKFPDSKLNDIVSAVLKPKDLYTDDELAHHADNGITYGDVVKKLVDEGHVDNTKEGFDYLESIGSKTLGKLSSADSNISKEDIGITKEDDAKSVLDKLIAQDGEFSPLLKLMKDNGLGEKVNFEVYEKGKNALLDKYFDAKGIDPSKYAGLYFPKGLLNGTEFEELHGKLLLNNTTNAYYDATHEFAHALTLDSVSEWKKLMNASDQKMMQDIYAYIKDKKPDANIQMNNQYGLASFEEFLVESMINPEFRKYVGDVSAKNRAEFLDTVRAKQPYDFVQKIKDFFTDLLHHVLNIPKYANDIASKPLIDKAVDLATKMFLGDDKSVLENIKGKPTIEDYPNVLHDGVVAMPARKIKFDDDEPSESEKLVSDALAVGKQTMEEAKKNPIIEPEEAKIAKASLGKTMKRWFFDKQDEVTDVKSIIRQRKGTEEQAIDQQFKATNDLRDQWNKVPTEKQLGFILGIEKPELLRNQPQNIRDIADLYKQRLDKAFSLVKEALPNLNYLEDYFPHFWKKPEEVKNYFASSLGKSPMEGSMSFAKQRFYDTILDGLQKGYKLTTTNPEELVRLAEMNAWKFKTARDIFSDMKDLGYLKFSTAKDLPADWKTVDDKMFNKVGAYVNKDGDAKLSAGSYMMPPEVAKLMNDYLSPGLTGGAAKIKTGVQQYNNIKNLFQLGVGAFHFATTTVENLITGNTIGIQQLSRGNILGGVKNILSSSSIVGGMAESLSRGFKAISDYHSGNMTSDVQALMNANAKVGKQKMYSLDTWYNTKKAFGRLRADGDFSQIPKLAWNALLTAPEAINKPLMEHWVPALKVGGYLRSLDSEIQARKNMSPKELQQAKEKIWDSMDDRLGQVIYDNVFVNKAAKDLAWMGIRSAGWTGGTIRAVSKGVAEIPLSTQRLFQGKGLTQRTAYLLALPLTVGLFGGAYHYLMTGQAPQDMKDYFFPKDGTKNADGTDHRVTLPSYMKDILSYSKSPVTTLLHKSSPIINEVTELYMNKDFYKEKIYNEDDPIYQKGLDVLKYEAQSMEPFSFKQNPYESKSLDQQLTTTQGLEQKFGMMPAPKERERTATQNLIMDAYQKKMGTEAEGKTHEQMEQAIARRHLREYIFNGGSWDDASDDLKDKANVKDVHRFEKESEMNPFERYFKSLDSGTRQKIFDKMNEEEHGQYEKYLKAN